MYSDPDDGTRRMDLAKGADWPDRPTAKARRELARAEIGWEQLRVLYVALTRAQHHTAVWWAEAGSSGKQALSRLLFARPRRTGASIRPSSTARPVRSRPTTGSRTRSRGWSAPRRGPSG